MQGILGYPRNDGTLNQGQVRTLIAGGPNVSVRYGLEMFEATQYSGTHVTMTDISEILANGSYVEYDNTAKIGGTATLMLDPAVWEQLGNVPITQEYAAPGSFSTKRIALYWGNPRTRLRPYMVLSAPGLPSAKFYLGVYIPASPSASMDYADPLYSVTCYDQTALLDVPITSPISYIAGTNVLTSINNILLQFQIPFETYNWIFLSTVKQFAQLRVPMSWTLSSGVTYLDVINALLGTIGYNNLYCDYSGAFFSEPWVDPRIAGSSWTFDATDPQQNIVDPKGTWAPDVWRVPNKWLFVQSDLQGAPFEGNGLYTVTNQSDGPASIDKQSGRVILSYRELTATSQDDLRTQGDRIVFNDSAIGEHFTIDTASVPLAAQRDVVTLISNNIEPNMFADTGPTQTRLCYALSWRLPLNGDNMTWSLGTVG